MAGRPGRAVEPRVWSALLDDVARLVDAEVGQPGVQPIPLDEDRIVLEVPELLQAG